MIDDLGSSQDDSNDGIQIELAKYAELIARCRTDRKPSQRWARSLRFLTFDDENDKNDEEDSVIRGNVGIKRQCQRCQEDLKPLPGHVCAAHRLNVDSKYLKAREKGIAKHPDVCVHVREATCQSCENIPLFPDSSNTIRLRIRRLQIEDTKTLQPLGCNHYVAVSYCRNDFQPFLDSALDQEDSYTVVEEDGVTVRAARAPKNVLDRAVDFCRQNGMRMIWIDQECIQYDDEAEKNAAVQAMDMVFSRAFFSIGLFQTGFKDQGQLDAFCALGEEEGTSGGFLSRPGRCKPPLPTHIKEQEFVDMLDQLSENRWIARAWTFQEAFVSGAEMIILLPKPKTGRLSTRGRSVLCNDLSTSEVAIKFDVLDQVLKAAISYFDKKLDKSGSYAHGLDYSKQGYASLRELKLLRRQIVCSLVQKGDEEAKLPENWPVKLALLGRLYPELLKTTDLIRVSANASPHFRPCNAAIALSFLIGRHNSVTADRLAIVANMCEYQVRLDLINLIKSKLPLSVCIFMLALMNGDFSLLCPESYDDQTRLKLIDNDLDVERPFSWLRVDVGDLKHLSQDTISLDDYKLARDDPTMYSLTELGLTMPGCLWKIDTFLDLSMIQRRYRPGWNRLQARRTKKDLALADSLEEEYRLATTHVLFEILSTLKSMGEVDIANAIWQSTFDSRWQSKSGREAIETVSAWPKKLQVHNRAGMFRVQTNLSGDYNCSWLIDRVMSDGGMWVGTFVNGSFETTLEDRESDPTLPDQIQFEALTNNLIQDMEIKQSSKKSPAPSYHKKPDHIDAPDVLKSQEILRATEKPMSHAMWQNFEADLYDALQDTQSHGAHIGLANEASFTIDGALSLSRKKLFSRTTDLPGHFSKQRAVFDINGDAEEKVFVFSPFRRTMEILPSPAVRTMSISWVVDIVESLRTRDDKLITSQRNNHSRSLRTEKMVRGMWPLQDIPRTRYQLV